MFRRLTIIHRMVVAVVRVRMFWNGPLAPQTATATDHLMAISVARVSIAAETLAPRNLLKLRKHLR